MDLKNYLFLFDIDGTLINSTGTGKKAFIDAIDYIFGISSDRSISFLGGIDNLFFKYFFDKHKGYEYYREYEDYWKRFKIYYIELLKSYTAEEDSILIYPDVIETVDYLSRISNIALVTGNIYEGAMIKLKKFGLDVNFKMGGYGETASIRHEIVNEAIINSSKILNKQFANNNIILFGDTQKDVESALYHSIIPVLIDHDDELRAEATKWGALFHGTFKNINTLLNQIENNNFIKKNTYYY